jgi:hypothetical protein
MSRSPVDSGAPVDRRKFLRTSGWLATAAVFGRVLPRSFAAEGRVVLPFENGER